MIRQPILAMLVAVLTASLSGCQIIDRMDLFTTPSVCPRCKGYQEQAYGSTTTVSPQKRDKWNRIHADPFDGFSLR